MKRLIISSFILLLASCAGHNNIVPHSVSEFLDDYGWDMERMSPGDIEEMKEFHDHVRFYVADKDIRTVWAAYSEISPTRVWNGPIARFGVLYDPASKTIFTSEDAEIPVISVGQYIFLDLFFENYIHIPAAFQITIQNEEEKLMEFIYLEQNTSQGRQEIRLYPHIINGRSITLIRHKSWFRSDSSTRDTLFYGQYHTRTVDEFHNSVAESGNYHSQPVTERYVEKKELYPQQLLTPEER